LGAHEKTRLAKHLLAKRGGAFGKRRGAADEGKGFMNFFEGCGGIVTRLSRVESVHRFKILSEAKIAVTGLRPGLAEQRAARIESLPLRERGGRVFLTSPATPTDLQISAI
jgi:hypothetical protein